MSENQTFQGTVAIIGAISGLLAATSSLMTIINTGNKPVPTVQINVDPSVKTPIQRSSTLQNSLKNPLEIKKEVEKTPIIEESIVTENPNLTKEADNLDKKESKNHLKEQLNNQEEKDLESNDKLIDDCLLYNFLSLL